MIYLRTRSARQGTRMALAFHGWNTNLRFSFCSLTRQILSGECSYAVTVSDVVDRSLYLRKLKTLQGVTVRVSRDCTDMVEDR